VTLVGLAACASDSQNATSTPEASVDMDEECAELPVDGLLTEDEQVDLVRAIDTVRDRYPAAADVDGVQHRLEHLYLEARLSGLCREGALELLRGATPDP